MHKFLLPVPIHRDFGRDSTHLDLDAEDLNERTDKNPPEQGNLPDPDTGCREELVRACGRLRVTAKWRENLWRIWNWR